MPTYPPTQSVLDVMVSCFANFKAPDNPKNVNLLYWLTSDKYAHIVKEIRDTADKKERNRRKATLPAITPSGKFNRRQASALIEHSRIVCLDIDLKGNEGISNYSNLKGELSKITNVAYCGLSVSGTGVFVLIPIKYPEQHESQFNALRQLFQSRYGIRIDATGDMSRLRGYSYDPDAYFNHTAKPFEGLYTTPTPKLTLTPNCNYSPAAGPSAKKVLGRCVRIVENAADGEKHTQLLKAARLAGGYIAGGVLNEETAIDALETAISQKPNVTDFKAAQRTIRVGIETGKLAPLVEYSTYSTDTPPATDTHLKNTWKRDGELIHGEVLAVDQCDTYPAEWDQPNPPGATPTIREIRLTSAKAFHQWQQQDPYFSRMGLPSLNQSNS